MINKTDRTKQDEYIISLIHEINTMTAKMDELLPIALESGQMGEWTIAHNKRDDLIDQLDKATDDLIKQRAEAYPSQWKGVYQLNRRCYKALEILFEAHKEGRLTGEEWEEVIKPINDELHRTRRYAITGIVQQLQQKENGK